MFPSLYKDEIKRILNDYIESVTENSINRVLEIILSKYTDDNYIMKGINLKQEDFFNKAYRVATDKRLLSVDVSSKESFKLYYSIMYLNTELNDIFYRNDLLFLKDADISSPSNRIMSMFTVIKDHHKYSDKFFLK